MKVEIKVRGDGRVIHRCHICRRPIAGQPVFSYRAGLMVAAHPECKE